MLQMTLHTVDSIAQYRNRWSVIDRCDWETDRCDWTETQTGVTEWELTFALSAAVEKYQAVLSTNEKIHTCITSHD